VTRTAAAEPPPVLVTRPGAAGHELAAALAARGLNAVWWPAFDLSAPEAADVDVARLTLASLERFDLAIFVSQPAVQFSLPLLPASWPATTVIAAVGTATRAALAQVPGAAGARLIAPQASDGASNGEDSGSEALWDAWQRSGLVARAVLIVRARHGREWLAQHFAAQGAHVTELAVYRRCAHALDAAQSAQLRRWRAGPPPILLISSTEAVEALETHWRTLDGAAAWARAGMALTMHPRIAEALRAAGYVHVLQTPLQADAIAALIAGGAARAN
jgi:uroporphyrinogen-III synthase